MKYLVAFGLVLFSIVCFAYEPWLGIAFIGSLVTIAWSTQFESATVKRMRKKLISYKLGGYGCYRFKDVLYCDNDHVREVVDLIIKESLYDEFEFIIGVCTQTHHTGTRYRRFEPSKGKKAYGLCTFYDGNEFPKGLDFWNDMDWVGFSHDN